VDHTLPSASRWRTRALVLAAVAAIELVVLIVIAAIVIGRMAVGGVETAARAHVLEPVKPKPAPRAMLTRSETSVVVLNGNGVSGAAGETAAKVKSLEYVVSAVGNAPRTNFKTMVMYRGKHRREAQRLAKELRVKLVGPLDGLRARDLMGAHLAVIVGR
jgi:LytR cell envelope-related transcriptional attenuator